MKIKEEYSAPSGANGSSKENAELEESDINNEISDISDDIVRRYNIVVIKEK